MGQAAGDRQSRLDRWRVSRLRALLQQAQDLRIAAAEDGGPTEDLADHVATLAWDVEQLDRRYLR
jgi:hypothetical protein